MNRYRRIKNLLRDMMHWCNWIIELEKWDTNYKGGMRRKMKKRELIVTN